MLDGIALLEILRESIGWHTSELSELTRHRLIRRLIGLQVSDLVQATSRRLHQSGVNSVEALQKLPYNVIGFSVDTHQRNRELKDFLYGNLYRHYRVVRMAVKAEGIIGDLFKAFCNEPEILPAHVQDLIESRGLERTICDYIAGMTDRFAIEEHAKVFDTTSRP
jgi:dGTPase